MDPSLEGALTNPIYLAFEARRRRGGWLHRFAKGFKDFATSWAALAFLIVSIILIAHMGFSAAPLLVVLSVLCAVVRRIPGVLFNRKDELPVTLGRVFFPTPRPRVFQEIWLIPLPGTMIAEALVLEERATLSGLIIRVLFWGAAIAATGWVAFFLLAAGNLVWSDGLVVAGFFASALLLVGPLQWVAAEYSASQVERRLEALAQYGQHRPSAEELRIEVGAGMKLFLAALVLVAILVSLFSELDALVEMLGLALERAASSSPNIPKPESARIAAHTNRIAFAVGVFLIAGALRLVLLPVRARFRERMQYLLCRANDAYSRAGERILNAE